MKLPDLNLLLYALNKDSAHHALAKAWLDEALNNEEPVGLAWVVILGFLRISTNPRIMPKPLTPSQSVDIVDGWLKLPATVVIEPGSEHWLILKELLLETGMGGNLTTDTHLAALAIENGSRLYSLDNDFARFKRLNWINPLNRS